MNYHFSSSSQEIQRKMNNFGQIQMLKQLIYCSKTLKNACSVSTLLMKRNDISDEKAFFNSCAAIDLSLLFVKRLTNQP